jgi:hypothetical protein
MKSSNVVYTFIFYGLIVIYIVSLSLKLYEVRLHWFLSNYLNDLLCLPILLFLSTRILRLFFRRPTLQLDIWQILFALVVVSLVFEWWAPQKYTVHTGDVWDVLAYAAGAMMFWKTLPYEFKKNLVV